MAFSASSIIGEGLDAREAAQSIVEGVGLALYRMDKYKTADDEDKSDVSRVVLCGGPGKNLSAMRRGVRHGRILSEGTNYARDLINTPSNEKTTSRTRRSCARDGAQRGFEVPRAG